MNRGLLMPESILASTIFTFNSFIFSYNSLNFGSDCGERLDPCVKYFLNLVISLELKPPSPKGSFGWFKILVINNWISGVPPKSIALKVPEDSSGGLSSGGFSSGTTADPVAVSGSSGSGIGAGTPILYSLLNSAEL